MDSSMSLGDANFIRITKFSDVIFNIFQWTKLLRIWGIYSWIMEEYRTVCGLSIHGSVHPHITAKLDYIMNTVLAWLYTLVSEWLPHQNTPKTCLILTKHGIWHLMYIRVDSKIFITRYWLLAELRPSKFSSNSSMRQTAIRWLAVRSG